MACTCCDPPPPPGTSKAAILGRLELAGTGCCNGSPPFTFRAGECCLPAGPSDGRWTKALAEVGPMLKETGSMTDMMTEGCCAQADVFGIQRALNAEWMPRVNAALAKYGLTARMHAFMRWISHGQYGGHFEPVLQLLIYSLDDPNMAEESQRIAQANADALAKHGGATSAPPTQAMAK